MENGSILLRFAKIYQKATLIKKASVLGKLLVMLKDQSLSPDDVDDVATILKAVRDDIEDISEEQAVAKALLEHPNLPKETLYNLVDYYSNKLPASYIGHIMQTRYPSEPEPPGGEYDEISRTWIS